MNKPPDRHEIVRRAHEQAVMVAVLTSGPVSRRDIATITHLSKPVVLGLVTDLTDAGPLPQQTHAAGRVCRSPHPSVPHAPARFHLRTHLSAPPRARTRSPTSAPVWRA